MARILHVASALLLAASVVVPQAHTRAGAAATDAPVGRTQASADAHIVSKVLMAGLAQRAAANEETYHQLRMLAIAGEQDAALSGLRELLEHDLSGALQMRAYVTAISIATNIEDWSSAFSLLNEGLTHLHLAPEEAAPLLSAASQLYALVGENERAMDLGLRATRAAQISDDSRQNCQAASALALAYEISGTLSEAISWRKRQIDACTRADESTIAANGKFGVGKALALQGKHAEALRWGEDALADYQTQGYEAGANDARLIIARSLIMLGRDLPRANTLLTGLSSYYDERAENSVVSLAEVEQLRALLAESRGDAPTSVMHLKRAMDYARKVDRSARAKQLAYLQMQFDTQLKEQQISLLETEKALAEATSTAAHRRQLLLGVGAAGLLVIALLLLLLLRRTFHDRQRYRWESEHDGLTRLVNQRHLYKLGGQAFAEAARQATPFTAIALDIDLFKQINDNHGHMAGDQALKALGRWIRDTVGARGIAARRGGDEFMILLDGDSAEAKALLQRLRDRIEPVVFQSQSFRFTISAGICQADSRSTSLEQLLHQADQALYRAKQQGRDRSVCWNESPRETATSKGSLVVVGSGIQFGRHASERTLSEIQQAQVVFCLVDTFALAMISHLRPDAINLGRHYAPGKDRRETYREIDTAIMHEVRAGKAVCAVFYGHPGVFADVPHRVIRKTRAEGMTARMEPGISAEACLYADLGIDPGQRGMQSLEATHFLYYDRQLDPQGLVLLWQVSLSGDWSCRRLHAEREGLKALVAKLLRWYPPDHEVTLYEAARLPIEDYRADTLRLCDLPDAQYKEFTTLVIPPLPGELHRDPGFNPASA